jgi:hypothetical protein
MRKIELVVFLIIGGLGLAISGIDAQPKPDAGAVIAAARKALGGDERLSAVKSFSLTGRTQQARGKNSVPNELEVRCERPDRCTRTDGIPARGVQQDFVRLTLGMFAGSFSSAPLTFSYMGQDEMPQGKADVIDARGPDHLVVRLFIDSTSRLPIMVSWVSPAAPVRPGAVMTGAARAAPQPSPPQGAQPGAPPAKPVESRIYYEDYRDVDGLRLALPPAPHRRRRDRRGNDRRPLSDQSEGEMTDRCPRSAARSPLRSLEAPSGVCGPRIAGCGLRT